MNIDENGLANAASNLTVNPLNNQSNNQSNKQSNFPHYVPAHYPDTLFKNPHQNQSNNQSHNASMSPHLNSQSSNQSKKKSISYAAERVIGNGSFGVVYQATVVSNQSNNQSNNQTNNQLINQSINQSNTLTPSSSNQSINQLHGSPITHPINQYNQSNNQLNNQSISANGLTPGSTVAIKKVLQDRRFKNREMDLLSTLMHPNIVSLLHCFFSRSTNQSNNQSINQSNSQSNNQQEDVYLNLVMEYIPETLHRTLKNHSKAQKLVPQILSKVYLWQMARALAYIHSQGVCHRDIKPQNILLDPGSHVVKICDFGSAKKLVRGEANVSYICSRYYRAPELVFEAVEYTVNIDLWSLGCVFAELLLGRPLFPGETGVGQFLEIVKVLGTPSPAEIFSMNPTPGSFAYQKLPHRPPTPWEKVFKKQTPEAIDLVSKLLKYDPGSRISPWDILAHPFFEELRSASTVLPNGRAPPPLFNWIEAELRYFINQSINRAIKQVNQSNNQSSNTQWNSSNVCQLSSQVINQAMINSDEMYEMMTPQWARAQSFSLYQSAKQAMFNQALNQSNNQPNNQSMQMSKHANMN